MTPRRRVVLLGALVAVAPAARAQPAGSPVTIGTVHTIRSAQLGAERTVLVSLPDEYARNPTMRFPVLVLLDADDHFRGTVGIARFFASRAEMPSMIVLGVSNAGGDRARDFMPPATTADSVRFPTAGGVERFVSFLVGELLPWADGRWRTLPLRALAGHSFGGVAALHAAATRPGAFRVTIAMSPSLWWNDTTAARGYAERLVADASPRTVLVTSGGAEPAIDRSTARFADAVRGRRPTAMTFGHLRFPAEGHGTTPFVSLVDALRVAFRPLALPMDSVSAALTQPAPRDGASFVEAREALERRYAEAASRLAMPTELPEPVLNRLGYLALGAGHASLAVSFFRDNVRRHPESANAFDSLGDGLAVAGDRAGAIAAYRTAVALALRTEDPVGRVSSGKLARLENGGGTRR